MLLLLLILITLTIIHVLSPSLCSFRLNIFAEKSIKKHKTRLNSINLLCRWDQIKIYIGYQNSFSKEQRKTKIQTDKMSEFSFKKLLFLSIHIDLLVDTRCQE